MPSLSSGSRHAKKRCRREWLTRPISAISPGDYRRKRLAGKERLRYGARMITAAEPRESALDIFDAFILYILYTAGTRCEASVRR